MYQRFESYADYCNLVAVLIHACQEYYAGHPNLSDAVYDQLYARIHELETEHPDWIVKHSPTQMIHGEPLKVPRQHLLPMKSLDYKYTADEVYAWHEKLRLPIADFVIEWKIDGIALELVYWYGTLVDAVLRGDGLIGNSIQRNLHMLNVPGRIDLGAEIEYFPIQGEATIVTATFTRLQDYLSDYSSARSATAGLLSSKKEYPFSTTRLIDFFAYRLDYSLVGKTTHMVAMKALNTLSFKTCGSHVGMIHDCIRYFSHIEHNRSSLPCQIDGAVIKLNDPEDQTVVELENPSTNKYPRWAISWKFPSSKAITTVIAVEWQVSRNGELFPVVKLDPIKIESVMISSVTLHNPQRVRELDLCIGDSVEVHRINMVIPAIKSVIKELRPIDATRVTPPLTCPSCNSTLHLNEKHIHCTNPDCPSILKKTISWFYGKKGLDVKGFSEAGALQLIKQCGIKRPIDILQLPLHALQYALGNKQGIKLYQQLHQLTTNPHITVAKLLTALGIPGLSNETAKVIESQYPTLEELIQAMPEQLPKLRSAKSKALLTWNDVDTLIQLSKLGFR